MSAIGAGSVRHRAILAIAFGAALLLSGCAGAPTPETQPGPPPAEPAEAPGTDASGGETDCVIGAWALDVADYRAQAEAYLLSLAIPLEAFDITGTMTLQITPIHFGVASALTVNAVVHGVPLSAPQEYSGGADWAWEAGDASTMSFDAWSWGVEPVANDDALPAPSLIDPGMPVSVACTGDQLTLQGPGAPLVAHFTRSS
ncbi:MAG TPA: hypothetical protein VNQ52_06030 [Microbacteriaceae bacterium]|nr:hypothetical protein [Microbacteriaceae bacterium]